MSDEKDNYAQVEISPRQDNGQNGRGLFERYAPAIVLFNNILSLIVVIIFNVGATSTKPTSGFTRYYTDFHILEFTALFGSTVWDVYRIRLYLNGVWIEPQYSGSDSDAQPLYRAVGRSFNVTEVLSEGRHIFPSNNSLAEQIHVETVSTALPFAFYLLGIIASLLLPLVWCIMGTKPASGRELSNNKEVQLRKWLLAHSNTALIFVLAATSYLTGSASRVVKALNSQLEPAEVKDANLGRVFFGLAWGMVGANIVNNGVLAWLWHSSIQVMKRGR